MKKHRSQSRRPRMKWFWILLGEILVCLGIYALLALSLWLGGFVYGLCRWVLAPAAGFVLACAATRLGLLNYIALLAPPLAQLAAGLIVWGYLPQPGPVFVCAFVSLVGAATGEVLKRQIPDKGEKRWKKT